MSQEYKNHEILILYFENVWPVIGLSSQLLKAVPKCVQIDIKGPHTTANCWWENLQHQHDNVRHPFLSGTQNCYTVYLQCNLCTHWQLLHE